MLRVTRRTLLLAATVVVFIAATGFVTLTGGDAQVSTQGRAPDHVIVNHVPDYQPPEG